MTCKNGAAVGQDQADRRFKKPKNGHFTRYCFECGHWNYERTVGCANLGTCTAIADDPTEQDAYDKPCGLFTKREQK